MRSTQSFHSISVGRPRVCSAQDIHCGAPLELQDQHLPSPAGPGKTDGIKNHISKVGDCGSTKPMFWHMKPALPDSFRERSQMQIRGRWHPNSSLVKRLCWFPVECGTLQQAWHGCEGRAAVPKAGVACGRTGLQSCCGGWVPMCSLPRDCWGSQIFGCFFCKRIKTTKLLHIVTSFAEWCYGCAEGSPGHSPCGCHPSGVTDTVWVGSCTSFVLMGFPSPRCYFNLQQCKFKPDLT